MRAFGRPSEIGRNESSTEACAGIDGLQWSQRFQYLDP